MKRLLITLIALILAVTPVYAADMLTGFHTIDGELYYFYEMEMEDARYGQMCTGELWYGDMTFIFDTDGPLVDYYQGPERD